VPPFGEESVHGVGATVTVEATMTVDLDGYVALQALICVVTVIV